MEDTDVLSPEQFQSIILNPSALGKPFYVGGVSVSADILSKVSGALYGDPFIVFREYVMQNAREELATIIDVIIDVSGRIWLNDNGRGMTKYTLPNMRNLAFSSKVYDKEAYPFETSGEHKVGIFMPFDYAERLICKTKPANSDVKFTMTIDFENIRETLRDARNNPHGVKPNDLEFGRLVCENSPITPEPADPSEFELSYTRFCLEGVDKTDPAAWRQFQDFTRVRNYFREKLDIDFEPGPYTNKITNYLKQSIPNWMPVTIRLAMNGNPAVAIKRPAIDDPDLEFKTYTLMKDDEVLAYAWVLRKKNGKFPEDKPQGIVYKRCGIAVGGRDVGLKYAWSKIYKHAKRRDYYYWLIGEVHVVHPKIRADLQRSRLDGDDEYLKALEAEVERMIKELVQLIERDRRQLTSEREIQAKLEEVRADWKLLSVKRSSNPNPSPASALYLRNDATSLQNKILALINEVKIGSAEEQETKVIDRQVSAAYRSLNSIVQSGIANMGLVDVFEKAGIQLTKRERDILQVVDNVMLKTVNEQDQRVRVMQQVIVGATAMANLNLPPYRRRLQPWRGT